MLQKEGAERGSQVGRERGGRHGATWGGPRGPSAPGLLVRQTWIPDAKASSILHFVCAPTSPIWKTGTVTIDGDRDNSHLPR